MDIMYCMNWMYVCCVCMYVVFFFFFNCYFLIFISIGGITALYCLSIYTKKKKKEYICGYKMAQ